MSFLDDFEHLNLGLTLIYRYIGILFDLVRCYHPERGKKSGIKDLGAGKLTWLTQINLASLARWDSEMARTKVDLVRKTDYEDRLRLRFHCTKSKAEAHRVAQTTVPGCYRFEGAL